MYPNNFLQQMASMMPKQEDQLKRIEKENAILIKANKYADKINNGTASWAEMKSFYDYCDHLGYDPEELLQEMGSVPRQEMSPVQSSGYSQTIQTAGTTDDPNAFGTTVETEEW